MDEQAEIYIVISRTGTLLSRVLSLFTGSAYNHASISIDIGMQQMYSFGRRNAYNPIVGGFVRESPFFGTFRRFHRTEAVILRVPVTSEQQKALSDHLKLMYVNKHRYHYNFIGLVLASVHIVWRRKNWFYCSEFVRDTLDQFAILNADDYNAIVKPMDFLSIPDAEVIYRGNLRAYADHHQKTCIFSGYMV